MKPFVSLAWIVFAGFASYKSLDALGVMDLPFNMIPWFIITGVFVIGGIKIIDNLFTENEDNLNEEQYFKDVDSDSVDQKNNKN